MLYCARVFSVQATEKLSSTCLAKQNQSLIIMERERYTPARLEELAAAAMDAAVTDLQDHHREVKIECRYGGGTKEASM